MRLRIAGVHAKQIAREDGRLIAARAGAHFQKDIAVVMRILGNQQALQLEFFGQDARIQVGQLFLAHGPGGRVVIGGQFVRNGRVAFERDEAPIAADQRSSSLEYSIESSRN